MWDLVWTITPFAVSMTASPGPNNVLATASATNFGFRRTVPLILGIGVGFGLMILLVGLGLGQLFEALPDLHVVLKYVGAAYLLYLAWRIATSAAPDTDSKAGKPLSSWEAALFQWVNPKAWIVAVGAITTYTTADRDMLVQAVVISSVFALISLPAVGAWALLGSAAARLLRQPATLRWFNIGMAALLILSILALFV